jgi:hypothetical protein
MNTEEIRAKLQAAHDEIKINRDQAARIASQRGIRGEKAEYWRGAEMESTFTLCVIRDLLREIDKAA